MNNELGRKITSLTLMTIMVAGGMTFAAPGMVPAAHAANATLFVSAESSMFENMFFGAQVIEIVISDPLIASLDDAHGSPDVEVNGDDVVMLQASDGSWYAYIADSDFAIIADEADTAENRTGLNFGLACSNGSASKAFIDEATTFTQVVDVWFSGNILASNARDGDGDGDGDTVGICTSIDAGVDSAANIVGSAKGVNTVLGNLGQISLIDAHLWPFIQTYDFNPTGSAVVEYNKAGANERVTLTFDLTDGIATYTQDRTNVPLGAQVHIEIGDPMLNFDPTSSDGFTFDTDGAITVGDGKNNFDALDIAELGFGLNGAFIVTENFTDGDIRILDIQPNADGGTSTDVGIFETGANTAIFSTTDDSDISTVYVLSNATRGLSGIVDYNDTPTSYVVTHEFGIIDMDASSVGDEWNSGEEMTVLLVDADQNLNSLADEDLDLNNPDVTIIPSLQIGSPLSLTDGATVEGMVVEVDSFSFIGRVNATVNNDDQNLKIDTGILVSELRSLSDADGTGFVYLNYDIRSLVKAPVTAMKVIGNNSGGTNVGTQETEDALNALNSAQALQRFHITGTDDNLVEDETIILAFTTRGSLTDVQKGDPFVVDFFSFGDRVNNAIYRLELEETGDNTGEFIGSVEYVMTNQLNQVAATYDGLSTILDTISIIVTEDLTDEDGPRINYLDLGADGVSTQIADQEDAPTHSGVVDLDLDTYKIADTVVITLTDMDLNTNSDLIDIFVAQNTGLVDNPIPSPINHLLDVTFDDIAYTELGKTDGFVLVETGPATGTFTGSFQIPPNFDHDEDVNSDRVTTTGTDIEVNYQDHRDASGETIEVGDGAGVRANTGSISLDRTVYPVPWGLVDDFADIRGKTTNGYSIFPVHASGIEDSIDNRQGAGEEEISPDGGDVTIHIRVADPDLDISAAGQDTIEANRAPISDDNDPVGPVKITVSRGADELTLAYAGGTDTSDDKTIVVGPDTDTEARTMGPIVEVAGDTGVFELDFGIRYTDGPASTLCPATSTYTALNLSLDDGSAAARFGEEPPSGEEFCILQGDILTVEYTDEVDASGNENTVTDSATFDLRNGVLQSDKSVYIIGSDMILTVIEPDWDRDNDGAETYDLDAIEWDSDAAVLSMGDRGRNSASFDPEPSDLRETGDSTGIFQIVIEIPNEIAGDNLERGEEITLEYTDWGPSGARYVGQENEDMQVTVYTSNFGATIELDQKVYTWTDKVYITIVAPDHNFDGQLIDTIGDTDVDPIKVSTRHFDLDRYSLVETGTDTGIFTGEVILTGFSHDSNGDGEATGPTAPTSDDGAGPTDGFLETRHDDGLTVSFEYSEDSTVVGSALIRWNIGEVQWLEASYPASGTGVVRIIDPDLNLNPEAVDNFDVATWSDSDAGGISLTVTETNEATGIFEGTVFFTTSNESSGHRLRVAEGDTVTSEYEDFTLPDPYTSADELDITATTLIGTIVPPLERVSAANLRTVDAFGNSLDAVSVDQQVQISVDLANGQDREQVFAYLVQIQDGNGVTVSLAWITGQLSSGQSFSPALSWIPTEGGSYTATVFVWESIDNPTALSPPVSTTISVS